MHLHWGILITFSIFFKFHHLFCFCFLFSFVSSWKRTKKMWYFKKLGCPKACTRFLLALSFCPKILFNIILFIQNNVPLKSFSFCCCLFDRNVVIFFLLGLLFAEMLIFALIFMWCFETVCLRSKCYTNKRIGSLGIGVSFRFDLIWFDLVDCVRLNYFVTLILWNIN